MKSNPHGVRVRVGRYILGGLSVIAFMIGGVGVWAANTEIAGAVVAQGIVVVESHVKTVQHPTGGVAGEILVRNGSEVRQGDVLIRLDETLARINLQIVSQQRDELLLREARLKAERDGNSEFDLPDALAERTGERGIADVLNGERVLLRSRREAFRRQQDQLRERAIQFGKEAEGIQAQIVAKREEIELIASELAGLAELEAKQLVTTTKVAALKREKARLQGQLGQYEASAAQSVGRKVEVGIEMVRLENDTQTKVVQELREVQSKLADLNEKRMAAQDQLRRTDIRAPDSGVVHQLTVHAAGQVIKAGDTLLQVVPKGDHLVIEARVRPQDVDQLYQGQETKIRFQAFDQQRTPELQGRVSGIGADLTRDPATGEPYFAARISLEAGEIAKLDGNRLIPGIPAEVRIKTQDRTALSYLMKPLADQLSRAFRER